MGFVWNHLMCATSSRFDPAPPSIKISECQVFKQKLGKCLKTLCILVAHDTSYKIQSSYYYATTKASNGTCSHWEKEFEFEDVNQTVSFLFSFPHPISLHTSHTFFSCLNVVFTKAQNCHSNQVIPMMMMMIQKTHHPSVSDTIVREKETFFQVWIPQQDVRGSAFLSFSEALGVSMWPTAFFTNFPQFS